MLSIDVVVSRGRNLVGCINLQIQYLMSVMHAFVNSQKYIICHLTVFLLALLCTDTLSLAAPLFKNCSVL